MFKNHLKIAFRNLFRNKSYAVINIIGLAIGIASTALIFLWVEDELTFNNYFPNKNELFKIKNNQTYDGKTYVFDATAGPLAAGIKADIPEIKNVARCTWGNQFLFSVGEKNMYSQGNYVDPDFLKMMHLNFLKGNSTTAFSQLNSVVLTEKTADKFFGSTDVIGKSLKVNNKENYIVSGVIKDLPDNTSFHFECLVPFKIYESQNNWLKEWGNNGIITYVEIKPNTNIDVVNKKIEKYISTKMEGSTASLSIYPMTKWRLYDNFDDRGKEIDGSVKYVRLFSIIAWIILFIACINFMNLATASSEKRAKEVGVKKALGSGKKTLIVQFLSESLIMSCVAAILAVIIIYLVLPPFNNLIHKQLSVAIFSPLHIIALLSITLLCGIISGSYPAFYLSSFNPVAILKGSKSNTNSGAGLIRKGLVIVQFSVSVILIICTIIIYKQIQHVKNRDIGYTKEGLLYTNLKEKLYNNFSSVKNDLIKIPEVKNVCLSSSQLLQMGSNSGDFAWPGKNASKSVLITMESVSPEYIGTTGLKLKEGRDFYPNAIADSTNIIINEALANLIGKKDVVGTQIYREGGTKYTVVGVVKDFLYNSMYSKAQPMILFSDVTNVNFLTIRVNTNENLQATLSKIEKVIKMHNPGYPFEYHFIDEQFDKLFKIEALISTLAGIFASLAIFISCLGLFGLASYIAEQRAKEISIRKVLGASVQLLTLLLTKDFLKLVLIACLLAFPLAGWFMYNWLQDYEYHVTLNAWIFILAAFIALSIAVLTVGFKAIRTAVANPIKSLRSE
ncbi:MAG TPA: ABC transporter permease [Bacteroidia bacterium]|nr:ABC transporter permease [Bacteroidia bacterium]